jgi:hypothetical protein
MIIILVTAVETSNLTKYPTVVTDPLYYAARDERTFRLDSINIKHCIPPRGTIYYLPVPIFPYRSIYKCLSSASAFPRYRSNWHRANLNTTTTTTTTEEENVIRNITETSEEKGLHGQYPRTQNYWVSDFVHRPVLKLGNTAFRRLDLCPSSGEGGDTYFVGFLRKSWIQPPHSVPSPKDGNRFSFRKVVFWF